MHFFNHGLNNWYTWYETAWRHFRKAVRTFFKHLRSVFCDASLVERCPEGGFLGVDILPEEVVVWPEEGLLWGSGEPELPVAPYALLGHWRPFIGCSREIERTRLTTSDCVKMWQMYKISKDKEEQISYLLAIQVSLVIWDLRWDLQNGFASRFTHKKPILNFIWAKLQIKIPHITSAPCN